MTNLDTHRAKSIKKIFSDITDPRSAKNKQHDLMDLIIISICAVICGAEGWEDIETFAKAREQWLRQFIVLKYGIPGHDTFRRFRQNWPLTNKPLGACDFLNGF